VPATSAHSDSADTYCTLFTHPVTIDRGIIAIQNSVGQPFSFLMKNYNSSPPRCANASAG